MKIKYLPLTIVLISLLVVSCEGDTIDPSILDRNINVSAQINNSKFQSSGDEWTDGDAIGIYMIKSRKEFTESHILNKNEKYITTGNGVFKPADGVMDIKFPADGSKVDFIAYYPHTKSISSSFEYSVDVSSQKDIKAIDLLYSNNSVELSRLSSKVDMVFDHQLSKVTANISTSDGSSLEDVRISIKGVDLKAKFSLVDKSIISSSKGVVRMNTNSKGDMAEAIVIPTANLSGITLEIVNAGFAYICRLDELSKISSIDSGKHYSFNIKLDPKNTEVSVVVNPWSSINPWEDVILDGIIIGKGDQVEDDNNNELGSKENPYTIEEAINNIGQKQVWVKGYIVGYYTGKTVKTFATDVSSSAEIKETCIALASSPDEQDGENTFPVFLKTGDLRDNLNINDNRDIIGTEILIKGNIESYYASIGFNNTYEYVK